MKKRILISISVILFMLIIPTILFAEYDPGCDCDPEGDPDAVSAPIDGGLSLLIAGAIGYGAKKGYDSRNKKQEQV